MNAQSSDPGAAATTARTPSPLYGGSADRRVTVRDLVAAKARGEKWPMLTSYDALTARVFDEAGIPVLLVGDSASMVVYGHDSTIPVTLDELIPLTAAVVRGTRRALVVEMVPERYVTNAVGLNSAMMTSARIVGPALAGVCIVALGFGWTFAIDGLTYIAVLVGLLRIRPAELHRLPPAPRASGQVREGLRYTRSEVDLWVPLVMTAIIGTFAGDKAAQRMKERGIDLDLSKINSDFSQMNGAEFDAFMKSLDDMNIEIDDGKSQVRITCE